MAGLVRQEAAHDEEIGITDNLGKGLQLTTGGFQDVRPYNEGGFCGTPFSGTFEPGELASATAGALHSSGTSRNER